jgi:transposase
MSNLFWLTGEQMARLKPYPPKSHARQRADDRRFRSVIIFVNRTRLRWCYASKEYGAAEPLYNHWKRWVSNSLQKLPVVSSQRQTTSPCFRSAPQAWGKMSAT